MMNVFNGYKKIVSFSSKGMYSEAFKKLMDASNNVIAAPKRGEEKKKRTLPAVGYCGFICGSVRKFVCESGYKITLKVCALFPMSAFMR